MQSTAAPGFLPQESNQAQQGGSAPIDCAIMTALEVERKAVCAAFGLTDQHRIKKNGRVYWRGKLPIGDGAAYNVIIAQPAEMGQAETTALATEVALVWRPRAVLMVGIAASTKPGEVKLGDVVVGRSVYYYEHGKITADGIQPQPEMIPADADLLKHYAGLPDWDGAVLAPRPGGSDTWPRVFLGVIASGDKVVAHAPARDAIAAGQRKILALEMEGYGFSRALWLNSGRIPHLVIRAISDDGNEHKTDDWHSYAAAAAAGFAKHFLLDRPLEQSENIGPLSGPSAGAGDVASRGHEPGRPNAGSELSTQAELSQASQRAPSSTKESPNLQAHDAPTRAQDQEESLTPPPSTSPQGTAASTQSDAKPPDAKSRAGRAGSFWAVVAVIAGFLFFRQQSSSDPSPSQDKPRTEVVNQPFPSSPADRQPKPTPRPISNKPGPSPQLPPSGKAPATIDALRRAHGVIFMPDTMKPASVQELPKGMLGYVDPVALQSLKRALIGRTGTARSFELHKAIDGNVFLIGYAKKETLEGIDRGQPIDEALLVASPAGPRTIPVSIPLARIQKAHFAIAPDSSEVLAVKLGATPVP